MSEDEPALLDSSQYRGRVSQPTVPDDLMRSVNLRDIGGYQGASAGLVVRHGRAYRSATLSRLEGKALDAIRSLGIRTIIDFRDNSERAAHPTPWEAIGCDHYWCRDHDSSEADLGPRVRDPALTAADSRAAMYDLYRALPYAQSASYERLFRALIEGGGPVLFHCAVGKDRTGVAAALILAALDVSRDSIAIDYGLTGRFDLLGSPPMRGRPPLSAARQAAIAPLLVPESAYLDAMFDALTERSGSLERYLADTLTLSERELAVFRMNMLDQAA